MSHRTQTLPEEKVNALTHGLGVIFAVVGTPILLEKSRTLTGFDIDLGILMFGFGMLVVYLSSTLYHASKAGKLKDKLHICDHVSIFFLIGGSYVPFVQAYTDAQTAFLFLSAQWTVIVIGAVLKLFFTGRYEQFSLFTYIVLGWSAVFLFVPFRENMPFEVLKWILIGSVSYSIGVFFYRWDKQKYAHAVWHLFVLGGTIAHYIAIWHINN
ncbi:MAG: hemolysin III family protein [Saprospiraceae bacterium]|nr:hemolysin III family protein [Saprospiraceae bacterium]